MKTTIINDENLSKDGVYILFNRGGAYFSEDYLDRVVLEHHHKTIINGVEFTALKHNSEGTEFTFEIKTPNGGWRKNTTQRRFSN